MKQIITAGIGKKSFCIETDAYENLKNYLEYFRTKSSLGIQSQQVMEDLEERIAEILFSKIGEVRNVVDVKMVDEITSQLGMPDGSPYNRLYNESSQNKEYSNNTSNYATPVKKIYRDKDNSTIAGVCSGIALYANLDPLIIKIIFIVLFILGMSGMLIYIILWIVIPKAVTPAQKCEQRGWPITAENLSKFTKYR